MSAPAPPAPSTTALSARLRRLIEALDAGLVERRAHVRLCLLATLAGEHSLLLGPPGTAKSELARRLHHAFRQARYFERLLTRFSVPEELFGPLSIQALEEDRYERHTAGFLPEASIAFIDEVFKANSAILNALLTLLNERLFDNGAGRQPCPLLAVIGASNEVPQDEVAEAFIDRFLLRLPVAAVSEAGFAALLAAPPAAQWQAPAAELALGDDDLAALTAAAQRVTLPAPLAAVLADLRRHLLATQQPLSDRRWVKLLGFLRTAAASEGRTGIAPWDLLLLPAATAAEANAQEAVAQWLAARLGVLGSVAPEKLERVVAAFEGQLQAEEQANDLDYDDSGRLRFAAGENAQHLAAEIGDAKGGAGALRMSYSRRRRYGAGHIGARLAQMEALRARIAGYADEVAAAQRDLAAYATASLWLEEAMLAQAAAGLTATAQAIAALAARAAAASAGFAALPRLESDDGRLPEAIAHEALEA